ncbi:MAG: single-stranded-DNA-specific exonuclease RecJ, partial [Desulfuromonadales bacterium]|nr:single-stranded-DNA-specific exonuclease RecJ [Desulfuromonadales bacterium]
PGVIGIVASRLVERYYRPTVLIALENGLGRGSARSIHGLHLFQALQRCASHLEGFGGHAAAAGLSIVAAGIPAFAQAFEALAQELLRAEDLVPRLLHDGEVLLEEITLPAVEEVATLAPFGIGNPEPTFVAAGVRINQVQPIGNGHLRFIARQGGYSFRCIGFGLAGRKQELQGELDLLFTPTVNEWRDTVSVQLRIRDWRSTTA